MPSIWITSKSGPERSDPIHSFMRAADSATKRRETADFERPAPADAGTSPPRQSNRSGILTRRDVDQHLVHGPLAEQVLRNRRLPAWHSQFLTVEVTKPWPLDLNLAAMEADLALRFPPAVRPPEMTSRMVGAA